MQSKPTFFSEKAWKEKKISDESYKKAKNNLACIWEIIKDLPTQKNDNNTVSLFFSEDQAELIYQLTTLMYEHGIINITTPEQPIEAQTIVRGNFTHRLNFPRNDFDYLYKIFSGRIDLETGSPENTFKINQPKLVMMGHAPSSQCSLMEVYETGKFTHRSKIVSGIHYHKAEEVNIYLCGEHEYFNSISIGHLNKAQGGILVLEMDEAHTLEEIEPKLHLLLQRRKEEAPFFIAIIGCFADKAQIAISEEQLSNFMQKYHIDSSLCFTVDLYQPTQIRNAIQALTAHAEYTLLNPNEGEKEPDSNRYCLIN